MQDFISKFDSQPAKIELNYKNIKQYRSCTGGILSICYIILSLIIVLFKSIDLIKRQNINMTEKVIKHNDIIPLDIHTGNFRFAVYNFTQVNGSSYFKKIKFVDRYKVGLQITLLNYTVKFTNGQQQDFRQYYENTACPSHIQQHQNYFCFPDKNYSIIGSNEFLFNHSQTRPVYRTYWFIVQQCDRMRHADCNQFPNNWNIRIKFIFDNNVIHPEQPNIQRLIEQGVSPRTFQSQDTIEANRHVYFKIRLKKHAFKTYTSIYPQIFNLSDDKKQIDEKSTWEYNEQFATLQEDLTNETQFMSIQISRSIYTSQYIRKYKRLDTMLAQVFGILGLLSIIFFCVYRGYNEYRFEQIIKQDMKMPYQNSNICRFFLYKVRAICYFWCQCCFKNKQEYQQQIQSKKKINLLFDVSKFQNSQFDENTFILPKSSIESNSLITRKSLKKHNNTQKNSYITQ